MSFEIWKPIKGYENLYEVSNHGAIIPIITITELALSATWNPKRKELHRLKME